MSEPAQPKKPGRPEMPPELKRTGRLPFRVLPEIEAKAKRLGRDRVEELIRKAKE